jgi:hypothetical protein
LTAPIDDAANPGRSGPPGNKNARTHGMYALKRAFKIVVLTRSTEGRCSVGRFVSTELNSFVISAGRRT